ncbi:NACHT domain-containing protein [Paractinoplanes rishiriensis]|uniref:NACHT domain-containing protein n=1 Tax=Paractinoplanes rishiriensis TaxID=1050105 RepID=A0A919MZJ5_9ACTN|nr:NACHT domain-containing protein [Actinoplanes rishiriensis]GIF01604.1 hypothetical protein Ari01nite_90680 [Actinoplanes rishiriensis]
MKRRWIRRRATVDRTGAATATAGGVAVSGYVDELTTVHVHPPAGHVTAVPDLVEVITGAGPDAALRRAASALRREVSLQWAEEAALRQVLPLPLRVRWSSTGRPVAASRDAVLGTAEGTDWRTLPLAGDVAEIGEALRDLPQRQLVVLGEPGAGKTVLAMLLTVELAGNPRPDEPVPVLLPIASWDPGTEGIGEYAARRLAEEYGFLGERDTLAERLLRHGLIMPVLDGLDELPADRLTRAIEILERYAAPGRPLVVTCRSGEYERAVARHGTALSRAAVVELEPVNLEDAIALLTGSGPIRPGWTIVLERLRGGHDPVLVQALSTPLMVTLARSAFRSPETDPGILLGHPHPASVSRMLLELYLDRVYRGDVTGTGYRPERALRWLGTLAYHLHRGGGRDLWWWELSPTLLATRPLLVRFVLWLMTVLTPAALVCGGVALFGDSRDVVRIGVGTVVATMISRLRVFRTLWPDGYPPTPLKIFRSRDRRARRLVVSLSFGAGFGLLSGLLHGNVWVPVSAGLIWAVVVACLPVPSAASRVRICDQRDTLRATRVNAVSAMLAAGIPAGLIAVALATIFRLQDFWGVAAVTACVFGAAAAASAGGWNWARFRLSHAVLAFRRALPWRLLHFADDANRRGVLRRAGSSWQFRHALLQDRLADGVRAQQLREAAATGSDYAARRLASGLARRGEPDLAIEVLTPRAPVGDYSLVDQLAALLEEHGRVEQLRSLAEQCGRFRSSITRRLARVLALQGRVDEAIAVLRPLTAPSYIDGDVTSQLARLLYTHGRLDYLRSWVDSEGHGGKRELVYLLWEQGRMDELRSRAAGGDQIAVECVAYAFVDRGDIDGAIRYLQDQPRLNHFHTSWLARLLVYRGRYRAALDVLLAGGRRVYEDDFELVIYLLGRLGRADEIYTVPRGRNDTNPARLIEASVELGRFDDLRIRADGGDADALMWLALLAPDSVDTLSLLRRRAPQHSRAARLLADVLADRGAADELRTLAQAGNSWAAWRLANWLAANNQLDELRARAGNGDQNARMVHVRLLFGRGQTDDALAVLRQHADSGDEHALRWLSDALTALGRTADALALPQRRTVGTRSLHGERQHVDLLADAGRFDDLRARAGQGDTHAAWRWAEVLASRGEIADAIRVARGSRRGDQRVAETAKLLHDHGHLDAALALLRSRTDSGGGNEEVMQEARLLVQRGDLDEAIAVLRIHADLDYKFTSEALVDLLADNDRTEEIRALADAEDWHARSWLAGWLAERGEIGELAARARAGDSRARNKLLEGLAARGDVAELRMLGFTGNAQAIAELAAIVAERGDIKTAIYRLWTAPAFEVDHARILARILYAQGKARHALALLRPWRHPEVLQQHARLLAESGALEKLRVHAETSFEADLLLAHELARLGLLDELRQRADGASWSGLSASAVLAPLLRERGLIDELRGRAFTGDQHALRELVRCMSTTPPPA